MEFLDTSDPSKSKGKLPTCKEYSCPGIYIFFTGQLVGFPKDSGQAFPFVIDYIGKASSNLYSRFGKHSKNFDSSSILCVMKMKKNHLGKNCQAFGVESSLTTKFATLINDPMEGGYDPHNTERLLGSNGIPFDIMATLYQMDLDNPQEPHQYIEGREYAQEFFVENLNVRVYCSIPYSILDYLILVLYLPTLCGRMDIPYCIVKSKSILGELVHMRNASCVALTVESAKQMFNNNSEHRKTWGGNTLSGRAILAKRQKAEAKESLAKSGC
ncbi:hypothetical protein ACTFIW_010087 [Dictyostelium discoideum]